MVLSQLRSTLSTQVSPYIASILNVTNRSITHFLFDTALEKIMEVMKSLLNMAGSQTNKLSKLELSLKSFDGAFQSLEGDAYKLQKQSLKQSEELEDGTCPQMQAEQTEDGLDSVKECVEEVQETLDRIDGFVHPCWGAGWKEVVNVTYSHPGVECPPAWQDNGYDIKGCGRTSTTNGIFTHSFPVGDGVEYDEVCGRINGYSVSEPQGFLDPVTTIDQPYVDGVSVTHTADDSSLVHIWTFATAGIEAIGTDIPNECPCAGGSVPPDFVGQNYFCEVGNPPGGGPIGAFHGDNLLWDGENCVIEVCCTRAGPPYFHSYLTQPTSADIDVRLLLTVSSIDISITHIELYVRKVDP